MAPHAFAAQSAPVVARPVVQAIPGADSQRLSSALARLGRNPRDAAALVDAADAAKALADYDAAIGFYRRADEITPGNPHIKAGLAAALAMSGDPVSAIPIFAEAEKAGALPAQIAADRGLAYDLVGANATAQHYYAMALGSSTDGEVRMRLAISQAIAGDGNSAQTTLMPLLQKQDKPGWRTRAFALAIGGDTQQAVEVSNSILPPQLAQNIAPYLRYMPRLTRAQQAAAANLGKFPRASEIGRDDSRLSAYATQLAATEAAMASRATVAANQPATGKAGGRGGRKGSTAATTTRSTPSTALAQTARTTAPAYSVASKAPQYAAQTANPASSHSTTTARGETARVAPPEPMPTIVRDDNGELAPVASNPNAGRLATAAAPVATMPVRQTPPAAVASTLPLTTAPKPGMSAPATTALTATAPTSTAPTTAGPAGTAPIAAASPTMSSATSTPAAPAPAPLAPAKPAIAEAPPEPSAHQPSLSEIFADLGKPGMQIVPAAGAVDIRQIEPARPAPPPAPKVPVKAEVKPEPKADVKPEAKEDAKPVAKGTAKRGAKADAEDDAKPDAKASGKPDPKGGAKADAKPGSKAEVPAKGKKPAPPAHPSRIWVQIGVGRDKDAIAFDWRRDLKQSPTLLKGRQPYVSEMGRTNRVLIGPFETQKAANAFMADARKQGFSDALPWTSPAGQVVDPLSVK
ncbi:SPOR domain-containing protein [Novosphingobium sp. BL-8A]